jgi:hypothetical protein
MRPTGCPTPTSRVVLISRVRRSQGWRRRFCQEGIQGLEERPRPGRPRRFSPGAGGRGFAPDRYDVLEGERDVGRIDVKGAEHGRAGAIMRRLQAVLSDDADHARRYAEHLRDGHYVVGVWVAKTRRPSSAPPRRCAQATRSSSTTTPTPTSRTWAARAEERRPVRCALRRDVRVGSCSGHVDIDDFDGVVPVSEAVPRRDLGLGVAGCVRRPGAEGVAADVVGRPVERPVLPVVWA